MGDRTYYTYYAFGEDGRGYIGCKPSGSEDPENDGYLGSFSDDTFKPTHKIIISTHTTPEEALKAEVALHALFEVAVEPHFANRAKQTSTGFNRSGVKDTLETREKKRKAHLGQVHPPEVLARQIESRRNGAGWVLSQNFRDKSKEAAKRPKSKEHRNKIKESNKKTKRQHWKQEWWDAVAEKVELHGDKFHWDKQEILDRYPEVSERTLRRMRNELLGRG